MVASRQLSSDAHLTECEVFPDEVQYRTRSKGIDRYSRRMQGFPLQQVSNNKYYESLCKFRLRIMSHHSVEFMNCFLCKVWVVLVIEQRIKRSTAVCMYLHLRSWNFYFFLNECLNTVYQFVAAECENKHRRFHRCGQHRRHRGVHRWYPPKRKSQTEKRRFFWRVCPDKILDNGKYKNRRYKCGLPASLLVATSKLLSK